MAAACLQVLLSICKALKEALLSCLSTAVTDAFSIAREPVVGSLSFLTYPRRGDPCSASIVGREELLSEIRSHLNDDVIGIIGIYGMGGVGKTTLLKEIYNQMLATGDNYFDVVIWVTVSRDMDIIKIQEDIGDRLGFARRGGGQAGCSLPVDEYDRVIILYEALCKSRFLLVLDDLWRALDLELIGIPRPKNHDKSKIVFTTRSTEVCMNMGADRVVRVDPLNEAQAWELFSSVLAGEEVDHSRNPFLRPLDVNIVRICGRLPLALKTLARAMSGATSMAEWREAIEIQNESPNEIRGMENVFSVLKFSFDSLLDEFAKQCLLYCSLFPEDRAIDVEKLVELWIGEGFLDGENPASILRARNRGRTIIARLRNACLVEVGDDGESVKMHTLVRDMALRLTRETYRRILCSSDHRGGFEEVRGLEDAERVAIITQDEMAELPCPVGDCPKLVTFLVFGMDFTILGMQVFPLNFFESMPILRVLDLSGTGFTELPRAIGRLAELRYLNLGNTPIKSIPEEFRMLTKLRRLDLRQTPMLSHIPREAMVKLGSLQALDLFGSGYDMRDRQDDGDGPYSFCFGDLECNLRSLEDLRMDIYTRQSVEILAVSRRLGRCTRGLQLRYVQDLTWQVLSPAFERLKRLERLVIFSCTKLDGVLRVDRQLQYLEELELRNLGGFRGVVAVGSRRLFPRLRKLQIHDCFLLTDLTFVGQLPKLVVLRLSNCPRLEELLQLPVDAEEQVPPCGRALHDYSRSFPLVEEVHLEFLTALRSISIRPLLLPSLRVLRVLGCPRLKKLPLGPDSGKMIGMIECEKEWWETLEWGETKTYFQPFFKPIKLGNIPK